MRGLVCLISTIFLVFVFIAPVQAQNIDLPPVSVFVTVCPWVAIHSVETTSDPNICPDNLLKVNVDFDGAFSACNMRFTVSSNSSCTLTSEPLYFWWEDIFTKVPAAILDGTNDVMIGFDYQLCVDEDDDGAPESQYCCPWYGNPLELEPGPFDITVDSTAVSHKSNTPDGTYAPPGIYRGKITLTAQVTE